MCVPDRGDHPATIDQPSARPYSAPMHSSFTAAVYATVRRIPAGRVASYGGVAAVMGRPRAARGVGHALHALPDGSDVPWWRVISGRGEISIRGFIHGPQLQRALLEGEGVEFDPRGRIDWSRFGWTGAVEEE
jgi:methylated-DNA-protein-cysteine methyltransferase related protein